MEAREEAVAMRHYPGESVGDAGQQERERQGLLRPSGPRFAVYTVKNRHDDAERSAD